MSDEQPDLLAKPEEADAAFSPPVAYEYHVATSAQYGGLNAMTGREPLPSSGDPIIDMMFELVRDHDFSVEKLAALDDVRAKMEARRDEADFSDAMSACQAELVPVVKNAFNQQTRSHYAKLDAIDDVIKPIYTKHGFYVRHESDTLPSGNIRITCVISRKRHSIHVSLDGPPDTHGPKGNPVKTVLHGIGSTTTYLRNKTLCMGFNLTLVDPREDDDGNRGGAQLIGPEECARIRRGLEKAGEEEEQFIKEATKGRASTAEDVEVRFYGTILNTLTELIRQKEEGEAK